MSTAGTARMKRTPKEEPVKVMIQVNPDVKTISVSPDPFYVNIERGEEVEWDIMPEDLCFTVHFGGPNGSPFEETTFGHNHRRSGLPRGDAERHPKLYKYTVAVPKIGALDPHGGVTP
jgi:hypothetical protein